ncbi:hypothetical protein NSU_3242 [Novosphingobium pentaromativorans US6-1]|uniref:Uncharacterized protein n=1 Tax=Novosphingobium pentaromativorans US6-1 TaxID=1088721 RepID=G6EFX1_9SPHN|nr:hypothetical protein NSU_3242 [Novosphingobium pentaromativorans US6-1]
MPPLPGHAGSFLWGRGQGMGNSRIETSCLIRTEHGTHGEDMLKSCLLQLAHGHMRLVNGFLHCRAIGMLALHSLRKLRIGLSQPPVEQLSPFRKIMLDPINLRFLPWIQIEFFMKNGMQPALVIIACTQLLSEQQGRQRGQESKDEGKKIAAQASHGHEASKCEGAAAGRPRSGSSCTDCVPGKASPPQSPISPATAQPRTIPRRATNRSRAAVSPAMTDPSIASSLSGTGSSRN